MTNVAADKVYSSGGPPNSCEWTRVEFGLCESGVKLLVNGHPVSATRFKQEWARLRECTHQLQLDTLWFIQQRNSVTARALASYYEVSLNTASMRLRRVYHLGLVDRTHHRLNAGGQYYTYHAKKHES